jgi:hypothetical protein
MNVHRPFVVICGTKSQASHLNPASNRCIDATGTRTYITPSIAHTDSKASKRDGFVHPTSPAILLAAVLPARTWLFIRASPNLVIGNSITHGDDVVITPMDCVLKQGTPHLEYVEAGQPPPSACRRPILSSCHEEMFRAQLCKRYLGCEGKELGPDHFSRITRRAGHRGSDSWLFRSLVFSDDCKCVTVFTSSLER